MKLTSFIVAMTLTVSAVYYVATHDRKKPEPPVAKMEPESDLQTAARFGRLVMTEQGLIVIPRGVIDRDAYIQKTLEAYSSTPLHIGEGGKSCVQDIRTRTEVEWIKNPDIRDINGFRFFEAEVKMKCQPDDCVSVKVLNAPDEAIYWPKIKKPGVVTITLIYRDDLFTAKKSLVDLWVHHEEKTK